MSCELFKRYAQEDSFIAQKCCIPVSVLGTTNIKIGDVVVVKCGIEDCICRVYPHFRPEKCVIMDDTVSYQSFSGTNCLKKVTLNFPEDFIRLKVAVFQKLQIKLVFRDDVDYIDPNSLEYSNIAFCLLQNYVVKKNAIVKFSGQKLADLWKIHSIIICETFQEANVLGKICRTSTIELIGIVSFEQTNLLKQFSNVNIGGISHAMELLEINSKVYHRILVLGPPGCGKTTLVKKFCCDFNCFTIIMDGYLDFTSEKCDSYCIQLTSISKIFPKSYSVIFIDNIDKMASSNPKFNNKSNYLLYFLNFLKISNINAIVIGAATHKGVINPEISNFFLNEVSLGVPSFEQRKEILEVLLRQLKLDCIICTEIAQRTPGFLAYDLSLLIGTALRKKNIILKNEKCETLTMNDFEEILLSLSPSLLRTSNWRLKVKPIYWKDIGGMKSVKERLQMWIERPLINPEVFKKVDLPIPRGVLLFGPPGCCKTTIARGLATECKANFFVASPSQIYSPFVGESEKNISELFYEARLCTPSIIFLDELDCLVARREFDNKSVGVAEKVLSTLLIEMDGFGVSTVYGGNENPHEVLSFCEDSATDNARDERMNEKVVVIAATNRPDLIDDALLRPGRFDIIIYVPPPNTEERESILRTLTEGVPVINVNFKKLALLTERFSGADLKHLHSMAGINALRSNENAEHITEEHYLQALQTIRPSISCQQIEMYESIASKYGTFISK